MHEFKACSTCKHWQRPASSSTVGGCNLVWSWLRRWKWLYEADAHDGCNRHEVMR